MRRLPRGPHFRRQRAFGLALILVILVLGSIAALLGGLSPAAVQVDRAKATERALAQAKAALIGYAARDPNRPGSLPCPDPKLVADGTPIGDGLLTWDGVATTNGLPFNCTDSESSTRIGRLPWRTLGLPELRDGDGELLWYVVSPRFRAPGTSPLNSDVLGDVQTRTATNQVVASNLVALVIAPGRTVGTQVRPSNHPLQYLELQDPKPGPDATPAPAGPLYQYRLSVGGNSNDGILAISHRDLFDVVDQAVHTRIRKQIAPKLKDLATTTWGISGNDVNFPFAVPAGVVATSPPAGPDPYRGTPATRWGLLPVEQNAAAIAAAAFPTQWSTPAPLVAQTGGAASFTGSTGCSLSLSDTRLACTVEATGAPGDSLTYQIDATVLNAGRRLVSITPAGTWNSTGALPSGDAQGRVTGTITMPLFGPPPPPVNITLDIDTASWARAPGYAADTRWFFDNEWYKQVFYSVAPDLLFGAAIAPVCTGPTDCLSSDGGASYNKDAMLILAARAVNGVTRPTNVLADYLEAPNLAGAQDFRTHRRAPVPTENDKVAIVAP